MKGFYPNSLILYVSDVDISTEFYRKILKAEPLQRFEDFTVFSLSDQFVLGLQAKDAIDPKAQDQFGGFELCLGDVTKETVDAMYAQFVKDQVSILMAPCTLDFGYTFVALDPDGHRLRVCATDTSHVAVI